MLIYLLIFLILCMFYWSYFYMDKDFASPAIMFVAPFCIALVCAACYRDKWELNMHSNTFAVILGGCFEFVLICFLIHVSLGKRIRQKVQQINEEIEVGPQTIYVELWKVIVVILIQVFSVYVVSKSMRSSLGQYGIGGDFTMIMYYFREYHMFSDYDVGLSSLASNTRLFSIAVTYIWIYIVCNNYICREEIKNLAPMLISISLGIVNSVILGSRGEAIQIIVAVIVIFLFLQRKYNAWKVNIKFTQLLLITLIVMGLMFGFKVAGDMLGRSAVVTYSTSAVDEVAKYLGAEIKNLDIFLNSPITRYQVAGSQTFGNMLGWIDQKFDLGWNIETVLPFQKVNGISLGNVYTVFYAYIYDFGYIGIVVLTMLVAIITQLIYEYVSIEKKKNKINFKIIINSYVLFLVAFSFFGERFFSYILNTSFIKYLLIWNFMIWFVTKLKLRIKIH